ncbi:hypothetical protein ACFGVS_07630 [Mucilaginibacter sp. AW1-7]|uniref:hypothetical protein n=1 Tax=Mucilaginibacter sp. AW1-7 TaxID=3349874 RepID=UPI003F733ADB
MMRKMDLSFWIPAILAALLTSGGAALGLYTGYQAYKESNEQKAKAASINAEHKLLLEKNYDKALKINADLTEASQQLKVQTDATMQVLLKQQDASNLLTEQAAKISSLLTTTQTNLDKANKTLFELEKNKYLLKDVRLLYTITYDFSHANNLRLYQNKFSLEDALGYVKHRILTGALESRRMKPKETSIMGIVANGQEIRFKDGPLTFYYARVTPQDTTVLWVETISIPGQPNPFLQFLPSVNKGLLLFQRQVNYTILGGAKAVNVQQAEMLMSIMNPSDIELERGLFDFQRNTLTANVVASLVRRESNNSFQSLIDLQNNYLVLIAGNGITSNVFNVNLLYGDNYSSHVALDKYCIYKGLAHDDFQLVIHPLFN